jgi:hypothetical protein
MAAPCDDDPNSGHTTLLQWQYEHDATTHHAMPCPTTHAVITPHHAMAPYDHAPPQHPYAVR